MLFYKKSSVMNIEMISNEIVKDKIVFNFVLD